MQRGAIIGLIGAVVAIGVGVYFWQANQPAPPQQASAPPVRSQPAPARPSPAPPQQAVQPPAPSQPPQAAPAQPAPSAAPAQAPAPAAQRVVPSFDVVRVSPTGETVIAGRAEPGAEVTVLDGDRTIATVTADSRGEWVVTPQTPLAPGNHELGLSAKSPGDAAPRKSESVVIVAVPEPSKPAAAAPSAAASQSLAVLVPRAGPGAAKALQVPNAPGGVGAAAGRTLAFDIIQYDGHGNLSVSGHAPPQGRVLLYLDNRPIGDTGADPMGDWSAKPREPVPVGQYTLRADLVGADGKVAARVQLRFRRIEVPAALASNQFLVVQPGNNLWRIARRTYGEGLLYTEIYEANRNEIVDPNLIYPDQVVTLPSR
ncbi:MAG: Ig-like domain-containing protein [Acidobacteriota bacterium]